MKIKYIWLLIFILICSSSFAQQNEVEKMVNASLDASELAEKSKNIQDVDISFCDKYWEKSVTYDMSLWKKQEICLNLFNWSDQDVFVKLLFVDGMLTNDQRKNRACGNNEDIDWFGQYVSWYESIIPLNKKEIRTKYAYINFPEDLVFSWSNIEWCLVYSLLSDNNWSGSVWFDIVVRKAKFITVNITKKVPFDFRYLSIVVLIILFLILRKKCFPNKWM